MMSQSLLCLIALSMAVANAQSTLRGLALNEDRNEYTFVIDRPKPEEKDVTSPSTTTGEGSVGDASGSDPSEGGASGSQTSGIGWVTGVSVLYPEPGGAGGTSERQFGGTGALEATCSSHPVCQSLQLTGDCCPSQEGVYLDCCTSSCSAHSACADLGLEGSCCPSAEGVMLDCCDGADNAFLRRNTAAACSTYPLCEGLADYCCPTMDGVYLDCCPDSANAP